MDPSCSRKTRLGYDIIIEIIQIRTLALTFEFSALLYLVNFALFL